MTGSMAEGLNFEERLRECRSTYKLSMGYAGLPQLPVGFVGLVLQHNATLTELDLSSNNLTDLPDDLSELQHIRVLRIKYNQLARLPAAVARLSQLATLELSGNQITKLDSSIAKLVNMRELDLSGNLLTELPLSLATLPKLEVLRLENNRLECLPDNFGELHSLIKLDISTNCLRQLPTSMGRLKRIQRIDAASNMLTRVPPTMGHLKSLKEFNLKYNSLDDRYRSKTEEGLSRLLAFLRDEEERERLEEIERLRPIGTAVGPYMEYRCKAEPSMLLKTEFGEFTVDNRCWMRTGFSLTLVHNTAYVFGGQLVKDGSVSNELFWLNSERMEWRQQPTRGDRPVGRYGHVAVYDPDHHQLVIFGGRNADKRRLGDVAVLDLDSFTWRRPAVSGAAPSPREGAAAAYHAGHMVLFGGHASGGRTNDMLLLELSDWVWSQPATTGTAPSPRSGAALCIGHGRYLVVHGGRNNFVLDSAHVLDLMTRAWVDVSAVGIRPPPRYGHQLHLHNDQMYLLGGFNDLSVPTTTLFQATMSRQQVDRACALACAAAFGEGPGAAGGEAAQQGPPGADSAAAAVTVGPNSSAAQLQLSWQELEAELPYNKSRATVMQQGQLRCYQLGSATLGRSINEDDAEKGLAFWDVYKVAPLDSLQPKKVETDQAESSVQRSAAVSSKASRVQHAVHSASKLPASFSNNSPKEEAMLAYLADFQRAFQELYPHRRPMPLTPANECGVPKFICTTLRPSLPPCPELYTLKSCAKFVSEILTYEPLANPLHPPTHLPSPSSVLSWQTADAFDASMVLCSLLLGAGYNAYVVMGYAPLQVTLNDQSQTEFPVMSPSPATQQQQQPMPWWSAPEPRVGAGTTADTSSRTGAAKGQQSSSDSTAGVPPSNTGESTGSAGAPGSNSGTGGNDSLSSKSGAAGKDTGHIDEPGKRKKYMVKAKPELVSKFMQQHNQDEQGTGTEGSTPQAEGTAVLSGTSQGDLFGESSADQPSRSNPSVPQPQQSQPQGSSNLVHAWVLVLPGKREVTRPVFVETTTGKLIDPRSSESPYLGVELLWNARNAWICMQLPEPHSDSRVAPKDINWDLSNTALWEPVLDEYQTRHSHCDASGDGRSSQLASAPTRVGGAASMASANSTIAINSILGGRPHTPTQSSANLPRTVTSASTVQLTGSGGGIAAQLSRVGSKMQLTAAGTTGGAVTSVPGRPDSSHRTQPGMAETGPTSAAATAPGLTGTVPGRGPPSEYARSEYARSEMGDGSAVGGSGATDEPGPEYHLAPDLPPSWVPRLSIARDLMDMRCPRGSRMTVYKRCTHEIFAPYGECARWEGLVERVTRFADEERQVVEEVRETFARRKDKLTARHTLSSSHTVQELFGRGSLFSVRELRTVRGERREITFYPAARLDGLLRRVEIFGCKLVEHYVGRDDHLVYRSATFDSRGAAAGAVGDATVSARPPGTDTAAVGDMLGGQPLESAAGYGLPGSQQPQQQQQHARALPILKVTQKYERNVGKPADEDVSKQVFHLAMGKTIVQFHHAANRVTAGYLVFAKDGPAQAVQVDSLAPQPSGQQLLEMYRALQSQEKEALQAVRDSEWEGREIARTRNSQEQSIALETPYYDICRVQADDSDDEPPDNEAEAHDYLMPFLPPGMALAGGAGSLTREQALAARERCLRALKDRLIERANIIQARLDEEQAALARRQASYARDRDTLSAEEEEDYDKAAEEATFRISILQRRLARHEETALQQYYQLDKRLRADSRLSMLLQPV